MLIWHCTTQIIIARDFWIRLLRILKSSLPLLFPSFKFSPSLSSSSTLFPTSPIVSSSSLETAYQSYQFTALSLAVCLV